MKNLSWLIAGLAISIALTGSTSADAGNDDEFKLFVGAVLAETEDVWRAIFKAEGKTYEEPRLTLFSAGIQSGCGMISTSAGPSYCPGDRKIYLDPDYFRTLEEAGITGDFAAAFLISREVGHHVQNLSGIPLKFEELKAGMSDEEAITLSIRIELQADCFAGLWGHHLEKKGLLELGDFQEAVNAAEKLGDNSVAERPQAIGQSRGTSLQRATWFKRGFSRGKLADCDTFNSPI